MNNNNNNNNKLNWFVKHKYKILISIGISIRILMLLYYYIAHINDPLRLWGDVGLNFKVNLYYAPIGTFLLDVFRYISFGIIELFAFYAFLWDLAVTLLFYYVIKNFQITNRYYVFSLFLINPFWFLNNSFSLANCGYHITDSFFFLFFFLSLMYLPKTDKKSKILFYLFLSLSICTKYYPLPAIGILFLKFLREKNWKEMKVFFLSTIPLIIIVLIVPVMISKEYLDELIVWYSRGSATPLLIRIIPALLIFVFFIIFRMKKSDTFEIVIVSILATGTFMFFSFPYLRWFQPIIIYSILKERHFFDIHLNIAKTKQIKVDNHILTFVLSFVAVFVSYLLIIFVY